MHDLSDMAELPPHKDLENQYRKLFAARFKTYCAITGEDSNVFQWLATEFGKAKSSHILDAYFKSTDKFIVDKGFAPKFIKTNIAGILAKIGDSGSREPREKRQLQMRLNCDKCYLEFVWTGHLKEIENAGNRRLCDACK